MAEKVIQDYDVVSIEKKETRATHVEELVSKGLTYEDAAFLDGVSKKEESRIFHKVSRVWPASPEAQALTENRSMSD